MTTINYTMGNVIELMIILTHTSRTRVHDLADVTFGCNLTLIESNHTHLICMGLAEILSDRCVIVVYNGTDNAIVICNYSDLCKSRRVKKQYVLNFAN